MVKLPPEAEKVAEKMMGSVKQRGAEMAGMIRHMMSSDARKGVQPFITNQHLEDLNDTVEKLNESIRNLDEHIVEYNMQSAETNKKMASWTRAIYVLTIILAIVGIAQFILYVWQG